jgi:hypothetical protein
VFTGGKERGIERFVDISAGPGASDSRLVEMCERIFEGDLFEIEDVVVRQRTAVDAG